MYLLFYVFHPKFVSFIEFLKDFHIYDAILDTIQITDKKVLLFKLSKSCQILRADKTGFPVHIYTYIATYVAESINFIYTMYR